MLGITRSRLRLAFQILLASLRDFSRDNAAEWAASIAYYTLLSMFPLILAGTAIAAMFVEPAKAFEAINTVLREFLPRGSTEITRIVQDVIQERSSISLVSLIALLISGSRIFAGVMKGVNIAFATGDDYSLWKRWLVELVMLLTLGAMFLIALGSQVILDIFLRNLGVSNGRDDLVYRLGLETLTSLLLFLTFLATYRFVPRCPVRWRAALAGALPATLLFVIARPLFVGYVYTFANYNLVYGSLAILISGIVWAWLAGIILLFGAEVASHTQMILYEGQSPEVVQRRHLRRSPTAKEAPGARLPPKEEELRHKE